MGGFSIPAIRGDGLVGNIAAGALRAVLWPLQALIAAPTLLFFTSLTTMLFCHPDGPFHWLNRVAFGLLIVSVAGRSLALKKPILIVNRASLPMMGLLLVVVVSLIGQPTDNVTWGLLASKYLFPFALFHLVQTVFTDEIGFCRFEIFLLCVLAYLSFSAVVFLIGVHDLVLPRFILDPGLGYHADRARGPFLQAVANGVSLNILGLVVLHGYRRGTLRRGIVWLVLASVPFAILGTMTRAVWLSFAASVLAVVLLQADSKRHLAYIAVLLLMAGCLAAVMSKTHVGETVSERVEESGPVDYRKAVYLGGWQMFLERPLLGWGFHQMPSGLPDYVPDYHGKQLYPHNTYLEVLVENGLLGLAFYAWLMWELWRLGKAGIPEHETKGFLGSDFHRLWMVLLIVYWANAIVVVMSYYFVNGIVFSLAGMLAAQRRRAEAAGPC